MYVHVGERAQVPGGWAEAVAMHKGWESVWGRQLFAHSLCTTSDLISSYFLNGVEKWKMHVLVTVEYIHAIA